MRNLLKFAVEAVNEVALIADKYIAHSNLLPMIVQHWSHLYKVNTYLIGLVYVLAIDYRAANRTLNLLDLEYIHQVEKQTNNTQDFKEDETIKSTDGMKRAL